MNTFTDDDSLANEYLAEDKREDYHPEPLKAGVCTECRGKGWVEGERMGGQFEQLTCPECDGVDPDEAALEAIGEDELVDATPAASAPALTFPTLNHADPSDADLLALSAYMHAIATRVQFNVRDHHTSPAYTLGELQACAQIMTRLLTTRVSLRERDLLRMDRFEHEERDEPCEPPYSDRDGDTGIALHGEI
jgi:hypothetical protein